MTDKGGLQVGLPSLGDLSRYQRVPSVALYVGLLLITIGAFGEISLSNRKLMLGFIFACFSFAWHYAVRMINSNLYDGQRTRIFVNWAAISGFLLFAAGGGILIFAAIKLRFPCH